MLHLFKIREQIQEDICTYMDGHDEQIVNQLCNIVVSNFPDSMDIYQVNAMQSRLETIFNYVLANVDDIAEASESLVSIGEDDIRALAAILNCQL